MIHFSRVVLTCAAATTASGAIVIDLLVDLLSDRAFAALLGLTIVLALYLALSAHAARMEAATKAHADKMQAATEAHAETIKQHVLSLERLFQLAIRGEVRAKIDAVRTHDSFDLGSPDATGTGPFPVHNGGV